ncbi:amphi-Trp domain-containing protein [Bacillus sp. FJAT-42315]|uniref:amphi-Trp domain-containing protein n=1 Tax=Bacillus sp. FJAT-42315 TaxID=2014077 RepID=UPI000C23FFDE|nr:amphi-Trp domain-containing protein [Bacillus sp. FJAT-42315]
MKQANKPVTKVLIKHKEPQNLHEFASMLETIAKKLKEDQQFVFLQGNEEIEVKPDNTVKVEYQYTTKGDKHSFEIEFDWYVGEKATKTISIR